MQAGSVQGVVYFTRVVPAIGEPGAINQVELFSATGIGAGVNLENRSEIEGAIRDAAEGVPPGTPWMVVGYSKN